MLFIPLMIISSFFTICLPANSSSLISNFLITSANSATIEKEDIEDETINEEEEEKFALINVEDNEGDLLKLQILASKILSMISREEEIIRSIVMIGNNTNINEMLEIQ